MAPFIHKTSDVQTSDIGEGTRIWQYCVILPGAKVCGVPARPIPEREQPE